MKITFVLPHADLSGGIRVVAIYAQRLLRRGHTVTVVSTPRHTASLAGSVKSFIRGRGWPRNAACEPSHLDGLGLDHRVLDRFRPITDADLPDADVVVATWWRTAEWVAALSPAKGAKAYLIQHNERVMFSEADAEWRERVRATWSLPLTKIAVAQWLVDLLEPFADGQPVWLAPNGVDNAQFHAPARSKQAVPTFGFMLSQSAYKGCDDILRAVHAASRRMPAMKLVGFGTLPPADPSAFPPETDYRVCPPQDTIRHLYAGCDAWLFGSRCEGFGLPILEAMACRTPVIGTPAGAAPELLAGGGGFLVDADSPGTMADAIVRIAEMAEPRWKVMSNAAYQTAARYNWDAATDRFEEALESAMEHTMKRACAGATRA